MSSLAKISKPMVSKRFKYSGEPSGVFSCHKLKERNVDNFGESKLPIDEPSLLL